jgi:hypothetical protein
MLVVAVFIATVTARPDSAGIVAMVNGLAYGKIIFRVDSCLILSVKISTDNECGCSTGQIIFI